MATDLHITVTIGACQVGVLAVGTRSNVQVTFQPIGNTDPAQIAQLNIGIIKDLEILIGLLTLAKQNIQA